MDVLLKDLSNDLTDVVNVLVATNTATAEQTKSMIGLVLNQLYTSLNSIKETTPDNKAKDSKKPLTNESSEKVVMHSRNFKDLTGKRFGRLTVQGVYGRLNDGYIAYNCLCDCGNTKVVRGNALSGGHTNSCGCLKKEPIRNN